MDLPHLAKIAYFTYLKYTILVGEQDFQEFEELDKTKQNAWAAVVKELSEKL